MGKIKVAVAQMRSGVRPDANLEEIATVARKASAAGAKYLLTPEMSIAFAEDRQQLTEIAEPFEANTALQRCATIAKDAGIYLHLGSLAIAGTDGKFFNRSVVYGPDGTLKASYDKIHLFDADLPGEKNYLESATYDAGGQMVTVDVAGMKLGLTICYDVRFGQLYSDLALSGAELIAVPAAFTVPTGQAHWETLLRARAIETGCYVLAAAQGGGHENGRHTYGHSMIVDPWGAILAAKPDDQPGLIFAEIDAVKVGEARSRVPALANRRPYSLSVNHAGPE